MKHLFLYLLTATFLSANSFSFYYEKANNEHDNGLIDKSYLNYAKAYNFAKTKKEKIKALGALCEINKEKGLYENTQDYAKKILKLDPKNKYAKRVLKFLHNKDSKRFESKRNGISNNLTAKKVINLICTKPNGKYCKCKNVKLFNASKFFANDTVGVGQIIKGDFVDKNEAIVTLSGCQPHSQSWGGYLLLAKKGNNWRTIEYKTPYLGDKCQVVHLKSGKDGIVCNAGYTNQGYSIDTLVFSYYDKYSKLKDKILYRGENNAGAYGSDSPEYKNTVIKSWKTVKEGKTIYAIIKVYDENAKKHSIKIIKKKID